MRSCVRFGSGLVLALSAIIIATVIILGLVALQAYHWAFAASG